MPFVRRMGRVRQNGYARAMKSNELSHIETAIRTAPVNLEPFPHFMVKDAPAGLALR